LSLASLGNKSLHVSVLLLQLLLQLPGAVFAFDHLVVEPNLGRGRWICLRIRV
jgi:hypothetical protein